MEGILGAVLALLGVACALDGARRTRHAADGLFGNACVRAWQRAASASSGARGLALGLWIGAVAPPTRDQGHLTASLARGRHADWGPALAAGAGSAASGLVAFLVAAAAALGRERPDLALGLGLAWAAAAALLRSPRSSPEAARAARWLAGWCAFGLGSLVASVGAVRLSGLLPAGLTDSSPAAALWLGSVLSGMVLARAPGGWGAGSLLAGVGAASGALSPALAAGLLCGGPVGAALPGARALLRGEVRPLVVALPSALVTLFTLLALALGGLPERVLAGVASVGSPVVPLLAGWVISALLVLTAGPPLVLSVEDLLQEEPRAERAPWPSALARVEGQRRVRELEALVRAVARHVLAEVPASEFRLEHLMTEADGHARAVERLFERSPHLGVREEHPLRDLVEHARALVAQIDRMRSLDALGLGEHRLPDGALRNRWRQLQLGVQAQLTGGEAGARRAVEGHAAHLARVLGVAQQVAAVHASTPSMGVQPRAPLPATSLPVGALAGAGASPGPASGTAGRGPWVPGQGLAGLGDTHVLHGSTLGQVAPATRMLHGQALGILLELAHGLDGVSGGDAARLP